MLANGSLVPCRIGLGRKGIPQAVVEHKGDSLDLLPVDWLCTRGCKVVFGLSPSMTTPKGRVLELAKHQGLAYVTRQQLEQLFADLPDATSPGIEARLQ